MNAAKFNTPEKCKKILMLISYKDFICYKCGCKESYEGIEYQRICKQCKSKISITRNTIFHNLRFGIEKAFGIAQEYYSSEYTLSSGFVAKKYNITQKTSWNFLKKIKENKDFIEELFSKMKKTKVKIDAEFDFIERLKKYPENKQSTFFS
jgi:hypothetical protein